MDIQTQFAEIVENLHISQVIPFLKECSPKQRKELFAYLITFVTKYNEYMPHRQRYTGSEEQLEILSLAAFVCCPNQNSYNQMDLRRLPRTEYLTQVLEWYVPSWFQKEAISRSYPSDMRYLADWTDKKFVNFPPEYIAGQMALVFYNEKEVNNIQADPRITDQYFWLLFEYPNRINYVSYRNDHNEKTTASEAIIKLASKGIIDRIRLLKSTLIASAGTLFDNYQRSWYIELFEELKPTNDELILLQDEIFSLFHSSFSKSVNKGLSFVKQLVGHKDFAVNAFESYLPVLLGSTTKSVVKTTLSIAELLMKTKRVDPDMLCITLCQGFISRDEDIQKKVATLIAKYSKSAIVSPHLESWLEQISDLAKPVLKDFLPELSSIDEPALQATTQTVLPKKAATFGEIQSEDSIDFVNSADDLIYFLNEAFEVPQYYHFDLIPALVLQYHKQVEELIEKLEPVFQKAYTKLKNWDERQSILDKISAVFILSYGDYLIEQYPNKCVNLIKLKEKNNRIIFRIDNWAITKRWEYLPYVEIHQYALDIIKEQKNVGLLSTPSHLKCRIDPVLLIDRLKQYQLTHTEPDNMDMQLAIQRIGGLPSEETMQHARRELDGEYLSLICYLLGEKPEIENVMHKKWWLAAALTRADKSDYHLFLDDETNHIPAGFFNNTFETDINNSGDSPGIDIDIPFFYLGKNGKTLFYEYFFAKPATQFRDEDKVRIILSCPNNHEALMTGIMPFYTKGALPGVKVLSQLIEILSNLQRPYSPLENLFFSTLMFHYDKFVRSYVGEKWIQKIHLGQFDAEAAGYIQGKLIGAECVTVKRYWDTLDTMFQEGTINKALEQLLTIALKQINQPVKDLKIILELYAKVLIANKSVLPDDLLSQLETWTASGSLKKVCETILKLKK